MNGTDRMPVAATTTRARWTEPSSARTVHMPDGSSHTTEVTLAPNRMSRRRSNRSTT